MSVITIHTLELLDWKGFVAFGLLMSCNALNHGPGLTHLRDLEHPLAGRLKSSRIMSRLDCDAVPGSFWASEVLSHQQMIFEESPTLV